MSVLALSY